MEYEVALPPGPLREAAKVYRQRIEDAIIPIGRA
jgi:hypothetical protein